MYVWGQCSISWNHSSMTDAQYTGAPPGHKIRRWEYVEDAEIPGHEHRDM